MEHFEQTPVRAPVVNPLTKYYRVPGLLARLPSQGRFMPPGSIELTTTGEVAVLPMRAADEMLLKSADALISGYAIEKLIESCVPAIKNVPMLSLPDIDVLLLAIRVASFGPTMPIETKCPKCEHSNEFEGLDVGMMLETIVDLEPQYDVRIAPEIIVYLRPYNLINGTMANLAAFQEAKKIQAIANASEDERTTAINAGVDRLTRLNLTTMIDCVMKVVTPEAEVTDRAMINEFLHEVPSTWVNSIDKELKMINAHGMDKTQEVQCQQCQHTWKTEIEFDPASFFGIGS